MTSTATPRFAIGPTGVWTGNLEQLPSSKAKETVAELEAMGYDAVWLPEVAGRDVFVHLEMLLSATSTIVGATGIANIWGRDAVTMTGGVKAVTEAHPERVLLGLGVSHHTLVGDLRGHDYAKPLSKMRSYLDEMDASPYSGFRPTTPVRRVLAALRPKMQELAAEKTDGIHPYFVPPEHTAQSRERLGPEPLVCVEQAVLLETDPTKARELGRMHTAVYARLPNYQNNLRTLGFGDDDFAGGGSDRLVDAVVAWGTLDDVLARVQAHRDAGADHVCIQAMGGVTGRGEAPVALWRELASALC